MEIKKNTEIVELSLDGVDFKADVVVENGSMKSADIDVMYMEHDHIADQYIPTSKKFKITSEEQLRSIKDELEQLFLFIDQKRAVGRTEDSLEI